MPKSIKPKLDEMRSVIVSMYLSNYTCNDISRILNISSSSTISRYLKDIGVLRTKERQLNDLHKQLKGRKWTNEQAKINVSNGVKKSYENNPGLRKGRSISNKKMLV